ncbi:hypothetical protein PENTCL1PPCAC_17135, partial [Pristionchus entomophagus]
TRLFVALIFALLVTGASSKSFASPREAVAIESDQWNSVSFSADHDQRKVRRRRFISQPSLSNFDFNS